MIHIPLSEDFSPLKIAGSGQCFRFRVYEDGRLVIPHRRYCLTLTPEGPDGYAADCDQNEFENIWRPYFDLDTPYAVIRERIGAEDPYLKAACEAGKGIRILRQDPWETLVSFLISQNRNIPAIKKSIELMCAAAGGDGAREDIPPFPGPEAVAALGEEGLLRCRVGYRAKYITAAARAAMEGAFDPSRLGRLTMPDCVGDLKTLYGVGEKVARCVALYGFHHLDAFPVDVWIRRVLDREYPGGYPFDRYAPYNGVYQQYMFEYERSIGR